MLVDRSLHLLRLERKNVLPLLASLSIASWVTIGGGFFVLIGTVLTLRESSVKDQEVKEAQRKLIESQNQLTESQKQMIALQGQVREEVIDFFTGRGSIFYLDFTNDSIEPRAVCKSVGKNPIRELLVEVIDLTTKPEIPSTVSPGLNEQQQVIMARFAGKRKLEKIPIGPNPNWSGKASSFPKRAPQTI